MIISVWGLTRGFPFKLWLVHSTAPLREQEAKACEIDASPRKRQKTFHGQDDSVHGCVLPITLVARNAHPYEHLLYITNNYFSCMYSIIVVLCSGYIFCCIPVRQPSFPRPSHPHTTTTKLNPNFVCSVLNNLKAWRRPEWNDKQNLGRESKLQLINNANKSLVYPEPVPDFKEPFRFCTFFLLLK
jgi:hypothetical protein